LGGFHANSPDSPENTDFADELISVSRACLSCEAAFASTIFVPHIWDGDGAYA
jgi:hypothetical protein